MGAFVGPGGLSPCPTLCRARMSSTRCSSARTRTATPTATRSEEHRSPPSPHEEDGRRDATLIPPPSLARQVLLATPTSRHESAREPTHSCVTARLWLGSG